MWVAPDCRFAPESSCGSEHGRSRRCREARGRGHEGRVCRCRCAGSFGEKGHFYEGLIVTGTGIKDAIDAKREILKEFPGGLAVEEEGYVVGLMSLVNRTPCLILRGISDRAQGDKQRQGRNLKKE